MTSSSRARRTGSLVFAAAILMAAPALANGGDFFEEFATHNWATAAPGMGPGYFGFVRDARGKAVPNAVISATIEPIGFSMIVQADILGHYRIPGFAKTIDPKSVQIGCAKPGYRQVASNRRVQKNRPNAPIEVVCTVAPITASAS